MSINQNISRGTTKIITSSRPELVMIIDKHKHEVIDAAAINEYWKSRVDEIVKALITILNNANKILKSKNLRMKIESDKKELLLLDEGNYAKVVLSSRFILKLST